MEGFGSVRAVTHPSPSRALAVARAARNRGPGGPRPDRLRAGAHDSPPAVPVAYA
jgi:hypothetical protein